MRVNWFETESAEHPFGNPGERDFATAQEALAYVEHLKARANVIHVQYEVEPERRPAMADGEVFRQGWVRNGMGVWEQQYRERLGESYETGPA